MATYESRRYNVPVTDASKIADGSVNNTEFQHLDGVTSDIQGQVDSKLNLSGGVMTGSVTSNDNVRARFGSSNDLQIYHDGSNSIINNSVGALVVNADTLQLKNGANNATLATFTQGGSSNLRFNGSTKLETTNTGVSATGELGATGNITAGANVNGNGQNLTNLNASSVASGTLPMARLSGTLPALNGSALTNLNGSNISSGTLPMDRLSGTLPALNGSALTNLNGSNISSGTVADARISTLTSSKLTGALPALDGSALTSLNASNLASGTVPDARLPASALTSDWVKIATSESGSNVANLQFIGTYSDYRHLKVMLHGKWQNMNNNASYLSFRVSLNASNFSTSQIYHFTHLFMSTNASNFSYFGNGSTQVYFSRWNPYGNQGDKTMSSEITLFGINETNAHKAFIANGGSWDRSQTGDVHYNLAGGTINSTSRIRGIQLFHADGANISAGCGATLYGIK